MQNKISNTLLTIIDISVVKYLSLRIIQHCQPKKDPVAQLYQKEKQLFIKGLVIIRSRCSESLTSSLITTLLIDYNKYIIKRVKIYSTITDIN